MTEKINILKDIFLFWTENLVLSCLLFFLFFYFSLMFFFGPTLYILWAYVLIVLVFFFLKIFLISCSISKNKIYDYLRKNKFLLILFFILDMLPFYVIQKTYQVAVVAFCFTIPALITYIFVEKIKNKEKLYKIAIKILTLILALFCCFSSFVQYIHLYLKIDKGTPIYFAIVLVIYFSIAFFENVLSSFLCLHFKLINLKTIKTMFFDEKVKRMVIISTEMFAYLLINIFMNVISKWE